MSLVRRPKLGMVVGVLLATQAPWLMAAAQSDAYLNLGPHPGFTISTIPALGNVSTMGLAFLSTGDMVWLRSQDQYFSPPSPNSQAGVWLVSNMATNPTIRPLSLQFREPTGVAVGDSDEIMVVDLDGVYKVTSLNPSNTSANRTLVLAAPPSTPTLPYHTFIFCPIYYDGMYYAPYSGTMIPGGYADANPSGPYSGSVLAWKSDGSGGFTKYAGGLRSPNGGGGGPNGVMMFTDNQGSWNPSCAFNIIKLNKFYGTHQDAGYTDNWAGIANTAGTLPYQPPAAWFLQSVAVGPTYGNSQSTAQPLYMDRGPYQGDWIMGDCSEEGISRVSLDPVNGGTGISADYNGSVQWFTSGISTNGTIPCPNRLVWDPTHNNIYMGTLGPLGEAGEAWPAANSAQPFYKIAFNDSVIKASFEILSVHSRANGVEVVFSQPVSTASAVAGSFTLHEWQIKRQQGYGAGNNSVTPPAITGVQLSTDQTRVFLNIGNQAVIDRVLVITAAGIRSQSGGSPLIYDQTWFTHNYQSTVPFDPAPTSVADREVDKFMQDRVQQTLLGDAVKVQVDLQGAYTVALSSFNGARVEVKNGFNPNEFTLPAPGRGLYILQVRQGKHGYVRPVAFN